MTEATERRNVAGVAESPIFARYFPTRAPAVQAYQEMGSMQSANNRSQVT